ncbi:NADPH-dependent F420 reductase [Modestobacter sp. SSW1-42]|uniref:NADPH-dependent F420 reductase n=1 Tax=Modestobacter sp. SSW1-42 TaxID=596372 RepID=UPI003987C145
MEIGIIGAGNIGRILAERLARAGHDVSIANSRAPETVDASALSTGATAVWAADAAQDADVVIVSVNFGQIAGMAELIAKAPADAVVIDTSNYFPHRDGVIDAVENGQVESEWVQEQYGRPIVKAWNSITTASFRDKAMPTGTAGRIALPIVADDDAQRAVGMRLVEETGFDAFDAGVIADSWRQQPGTPAYTTDLTTEELPAALDRAQRNSSARRRDLMMAVYQERVQADGKEPDPDRQLALTRAMF